MFRTTRYSTSSMGQCDKETKNGHLGDKDTENQDLYVTRKKEKNDWGDKETETMICVTRENKVQYIMTGSGCTG